MKHLLLLLAVAVVAVFATVPFAHADDVPPAAGTYLLTPNTIPYQAPFLMYVTNGTPPVLLQSTGSIEAIGQHPYFNWSPGPPGMFVSSDGWTVEFIENAETGVIVFYIKNQYGITQQHGTAVKQ